MELITLLSQNKVDLTAARLLMANFETVKEQGLPVVVGNPFRQWLSHSGLFYPQQIQRIDRVRINLSGTVSCINIEPNEEDAFAIRATNIDTPVVDGNSDSSPSMDAHGVVIMPGVIQMAVYSARRRLDQHAIIPTALLPLYVAWPARRIDTV